MNQYKLAERAVLMRLSIGLPGEARQDPGLTDDVKREHALGSGAGKWIKSLFPPEALQKIKKLDNEARAYHLAVTLPFDSGIGILPAPLVMEYGDRMRAFAAMREQLIEREFLADPQKWVDWAQRNHNGTFDPDLYPGCFPAADLPEAERLAQVLSDNTPRKFLVDAEEFRSEMREKFSFRTEPLPVPDAAHFTSTMHSLLGTDAESINVRVADAMEEAQKELMKRLIAPVKAMAEKLNEAKPIFRDTLIGNLQDIAKLAPKLNLSGDPVIDGFCKEIAKLGSKDPEQLRKNTGDRSAAQVNAADLLKRLSGYKI
jgi:hypothetical protein